MRYLIREKLFHLKEDSTIMNEAGQPILEVDAKLFSLHDRLFIRDLSGNEVASVYRRLLALGPTYEITRNGQEFAELRKQLISPFVDRFTIDIPGPNDLHITGSIFEHDFTIEQSGQLVATISKRWLSLSDTYSVDIAPGQDDILILASVLALDLIEDHEHERH